jgi:hypothetical protein
VTTGVVGFLPGIRLAIVCERPPARVVMVLSETLDNR